MPRDARLRFRSVVLPHGNQPREQLAELQEHVKKSKKAQAKASAADIIGQLDDVLAGAVHQRSLQLAGRSGFERRLVAASLRPARLCATIG